EFDALALNVAGNIHGTDRTNSFTVSTGGGAPDTSNTVTVTVREPAIGIAKSHTLPAGAPADAGDVVEYTLVVENAAAPRVAGFDLVVTDVLPASLTLDVGS